MRYGLGVYIQVDLSLSRVMLEVWFPPHFAGL